MDDLLAVASVDFSDDFLATLINCWPAIVRTMNSYNIIFIIVHMFVCIWFMINRYLQDKKSLYTSPEEFQMLVKQVLSWDIRSVSQRTQVEEIYEKIKNERVYEDDGRDIIYHLNLEGLDVAYRITSYSNVLVENVTVSSK